VNIQNKAGYLLLFTLALLVFQTDLYGAETKPVQSLPFYRLTVSFDLKNNLLKGTAAITLPDTGDMMVSAGNLRIMSVTLNGSPADYKIRDGLFKIGGKGTLEIRYEGTFKGETGNADNLQNAGVASSGVVSARGVSLTEEWYPAINGLAYYKLSALVPGDFIAISEADEIIAKGVSAGKEYSFVFSHPLTGISLVAGDYREVRDTVDGIGVYAYFFPEDVSLAADYIEHAKKYFKMYNTLLVPYPYKRFSIVENIQSTGLSMPTFTLLGRDIVRLPFIPETSLGHEITHQWFGNYVFADFRKGNWLEAITTYLSDHLYEEQKGKGWEYRKNILINFQSHVTPEKDFPLREFTVRTGFSSMAIGYGKGAMLFHMLENLVGRETFYKSLRRLIDEHKFQNASWTDIEGSFERESGKDLGRFFSQWLDRKGVPSFEVRYPGARFLKETPTVSFELRQKGEPYRVEMPVKVASEKGAVQEVLPLEKERHYFNIAVKEDPLDLIVDGDYDIMRTLSRDEFPPVIARLLGDERRLIVYPEKEKERYAGLMTIFKQEGFDAKEQGEVNDKDIKSSSLLILGSENTVLKRLFGAAGPKKPGFLFIVRNNPLNESKVAAYASGDSTEEVDLAAKKIFHYGKYSVLHFEKGKNVAKEIAETDRGMVFNLHDPVEGADPGRSLHLREIIDAIGDKPVILIGERHTNYEDHKVELAVITGLHKKGRKLTIGMEMFQRPFQEAIDGYLSAALDEREFLERTEYFKRWSFDYNYYREIIEYARAKGIPIIALNQRTEIIDKVSRGGLDALSAEERKEIPEDMDMSDASYKDRLKEIYEDHPRGSTFDNFYQSQILWDETMAHSAARALEEKPDSQMVVLAGANHIMYGSGIPGRIRRLTGKDYVTLIIGGFGRDIGTYVLFPGPVEPPFTARLGVIAKEAGGVVTVNEFSPDSLALKAGLKEGDIITFINDRRIEAVSDLKIALFDKEPGQTINVKVVRKRFLLGDSKLEFNITLFKD
jgi:aminopeptidase N